MQNWFVVDDTNRNTHGVCVISDVFPATFSIVVAPMSSLHLAPLQPTELDNMNRTAFVKYSIRIQARLTSCAEYVQKQGVGRAELACRPC